MYITWFDPGMSTGVVQGWFNETSHYEPRGAWHVPGGPRGLDAWLEGKGWGLGSDIIGCEKFIPRTIEGGSHTLESTIPLVGEGVLCAKGIMPYYPEGNWQPATSQVLTGGETAEDRRKNTNLLLQAKGLWLTGSDIDSPDANDAHSATKHILYYLTRTLRHRPTRDWLYGEE